jgi:hypothetical protein
MNTLNPDFFESWPFWVPETLEAAEFLAEIEDLNVETCSIELLPQLARRAPSPQAAFWLMRAYFSRKYAIDTNTERFFCELYSVKCTNTEPVAPPPPGGMKM